MDECKHGLRTSEIETQLSESKRYVNQKNPFIGLPKENQKSYYGTQATTRIKL